MHTRAGWRTVALAATFGLITTAFVAQVSQRASASPADDSLALSWVQPLTEASTLDPRAVSLDGSRLYYSGSGSDEVEAFDTATHLPVGVLRVPLASNQQEPRVETLTAGPDGTLYALYRVTVVTTAQNGANSFADQLEIARFDVSTGSVSHEVPVGDKDDADESPTTDSLLVSGDGSQVYALLTDRLDVVGTATMSEVHSWPGGFGSATAVDGGVWGSWSTLSATGVETTQLGLIDPNTGMLSPVPASDSAALAVSETTVAGALPDGAHVVVAVRQSDGGYTMSILDVADGTLTQVLQDTALTTLPQLSADGSTLFVPERVAGDTTVSAVDLATDAVTQVAGVPTSTTVALMPAGSTGFFDFSVAPGASVYTSTMYEFSPSGALPALTSIDQPTVANRQVGETATVSPGTWATPPDAVAYQWYSDFTPITGATNSSLPITAQMYGHRVYAVVTASAAGYSSDSVVSDVVSAFPGQAALAVSTPTISGRVGLGSTLTARPGAWTAGTAFAYQWYSGGAAISGATKQTFTPTSAQEGTKITVTVTGTLTGYVTTSRTSAATASVPVVAYRPTAKAALAGADRYGTAVAISKSSFPKAGSAKTVIVASGTGFADALSAAPAAVKLGGPLLLTQPTKLPASVAAEIKRLGPQHIVVVGGPAAVSGSVEAALSRIAPTVRVSGPDRYATSLAIARYAFGSTKVPAAFFASGAGFADALSASAFAGANDMPVLLVPSTGSSLPSGYRSWLKGAHTTTLDIAGGTSAISFSMQNAIGEVSGWYSPYAGADRFDTNRLINQGEYPGAGTAYLASGMNFPDALAGAAAAGKADEPLYLTEQSCVPSATVSALKMAGIGSVQPLGGASALGAGVARMAACR